MFTYNYFSKLKVNKGDTKTHCGHYGKKVVPDLNVSLYEMLVRHQSGDITTLGGMIRRDAQYSSEEDVKEMRVALENDPNFNVITAKYYLKQQQQKAAQMVGKDIAAKRVSQKNGNVTIDNGNNTVA